MPFACPCAPTFQEGLAAVTDADGKIEISCGQLPRLKSWKFQVPAFPRHVLENLVVAGPPAKTSFWEHGFPRVSGGGFLNTSGLRLIEFALPC